MKDYLIHFLAFFFALAPALLWLVLWYKKDSKEPEPKKMIARSFIYGCLAILPILGIGHVLNHSPNLMEFWNTFAGKTFYISVVVATFLLAVLEEGLKHIAVLELGSRLKIEFNQIVDGVIYSVSAALGFAFMENIFYFFEALITNGISQSFWPIFAFRSFGTMMGHTIFSGVFGLFWGYAFLSMKITPHHTVSVKKVFHKFWETIRFHIIFQHILKGEPSPEGHEKRELVAEALLMAIILHTVFNLLIEIEVFGHSLTFLVVPILMAGFLFLSHAFLIKRNVKIWKKAV